MSETIFLNVDLDLEGMASLDPLIEALGSSVCVVHKEGLVVSLELSESPVGPGDAIVRFSKLIDELPPDVNDLWNRCRMRQFNIGMRCGDSAHEARIELPLEILRRALGVGVDVVVTIYRARS